MSVNRNPALSTLHVLVAGLSVLAIGILGGAVYAAQPGPSLTASPSSGAAGTVLKLSGTNFPKRVQVTLTWNGSALGTLADATLPNGTFSGSVTIPSSAALGNYTLGAVASGTSASTTIQVVAGSTASVGQSVASPTPTAPATATPKATSTPTPKPTSTATPVATLPPATATPAVATATPTSVASGPPSITITNPLSNQSYMGTIQVQAVGQYLQSVSYVVDNGAAVPMTYASNGGLWSATLDTTGLSSTTHNVDVVGNGTNGTTVSDRAWNILITNQLSTATATPVATVLATATSVPAVSGPSASTPKQFGVNQSGGEFGTNVPGTLGVDYIYPPNTSVASYFSARGLRLTRLPIRWERVQRSALGPLSTSDIAAIRTSLDNAQAAGQQVILDLHNFGRYYNTALTTADAPKLANVWQQLAQTFRGHPALYGYELMNEPHDLPEGGTGWATLAQAATDAIRQVDTTAWVLVPGYGWQAASDWSQNNSTLAVRDSSGRLAYAAHQYFDHDNTGTYAGSYDAEGAYPTIGVDRVQPFLNWLTSHNARGLLTEYGVPGSDSRWLTVLDNFLNTISAAPAIQGGTYWAAGPWWGSYPLSVEPSGSGDAPQMGILAKYPSR